MMAEENNPYEIYEKARIAMKRLEVKKGDIVVVYFPSDIDPAQMHVAAEHLRDVAEEVGTSFLCMRYGMTVENISEEQMNQFGWYRRD
jgi:hypothetical protein